MNLIMDVDTGIDDALAIILALRSKQVQLQGITTVAGNTNLEQVIENTLKILNLVGRLDVPVARGGGGSLQSKRVNASTTGKDGLCNISDNLEMPEKELENRSALEFIKSKLKESKEKMTIVATAPLTNIASLLKQYPEIKEKIKELIIMGGVIEPEGNITLEAEFNFYSDPEAVRYVFQTDVSKILIPLNVTEKVLITKDWVDKKYWESTDPIISFLRRAVEERYRFLGYDWMYLHDPLALGVAIDNSFVKIKTNKLDIITTGDKKGKVIKSNKGSEVNRAYKVDKERFINFFGERLLKK